MNKLLPLLAFSILLLVPVGAQNVFAGGGLCIENPNPVELTLAQGESQTIQKQISDCDFQMGDVSIFTGDASFFTNIPCNELGIDVSLQTNSISDNLWQGDETITNTGGNPGTTTCEQLLTVFAVTGGADTAIQTIIVTTSTTVVGGELLPIDTTSLLLAAASSPASWLTSLTIAILGIGAYVFTRNPNNMRNIKVILRDYLDRF